MAVVPDHLASRSPSSDAGGARTIGHGLAGLIAVLAIVAGVAAMRKGLPAAMSVTLIVVGVTSLVMIYYSLKDSRAAWSLLVAILVVFALVTLFGAPTIRKNVGIPLALALVLPVIQLVAVIALADIRHRYRER